MLNTVDDSLKKFLLSAIDSKVGTYDDPTVLGFSLYFDFNGSMRDDSTGQGASPLFNESKSKDSAINYLKSIGEFDRADSLLEFKNGLRTLNQDYPYYFTSISGLQSLIKLEETVGWNLKDFRLTIETLESIELRVTGMIENYLTSVYDTEFNRWMVPENLRKFYLQVQVTEIRNIKSFIKDVTSPTGASSIQSINDKLSILTYDFWGCQFDFNEAHPFLEHIENKTGEGITNKFSIMADRSNNRNHRLQLIDFGTDELGNDGTPINNVTAGGTTIRKGKKSPFGPNIKSVFKSDVAKLNSLFKIEENLLKSKLNPETFVERGINAIQQTVFNKIIGLALGNVFSDLSALTQNDLFTNVTDFIKNAGKNIQNTIVNKKIDLGEISPNPKTLNDLFDLNLIFNTSDLGKLDDVAVAPNPKLLGSDLDVPLPVNNTDGLGTKFDSPLPVNGTSGLGSNFDVPLPVNNVKTLDDLIDLDIPVNNVGNLGDLVDTSIDDTIHPSGDKKFDLADFPANITKDLSKIDLPDKANGVPEGKLVVSDDTTAKFNQTKIPFDTPNNKFIQDKIDLPGVDNKAKLGAFDFGKPSIQPDSLGNQNLGKLDANPNDLGSLFKLAFDTTVKFDAETINLPSVQSGILSFSKLFSLDEPSNITKSLGSREELQSLIIGTVLADNPLKNDKIELSSQTDVMSSNIKDFDKVPVSSTIQHIVAGTLGYIFTQECPIK